jgi:hypothetical protein
MLSLRRRLNADKSALLLTLLDSIRKKLSMLTLLVSNRKQCETYSNTLKVV